MSFRAVLTAAALKFTLMSRLPYLHVEGEEEEHIVTTAYYAMFTYNAGTIKNLGLINPTYELTEEHQDLSKAANLVGCNEENGVVEYVYVIDDRPGDLHAGIRMQVPYGQTQTTYSAAGIVTTLRPLP